MNGGHVWWDLPATKRQSVHPPQPPPPGMPTTITGTTDTTTWYIYNTLVLNGKFYLHHGKVENRGILPWKMC